jgi:hypothetical protein
VQIAQELKSESQLRTSRPSDESSPKNSKSQSSSLVMGDKLIQRLRSQTMAAHCTGAKHGNPPGYPIVPAQKGDN